MRELLTQRTVRLFIAGQVLSTLGDSSLWIAIGIWIKLLTGSSSAAGLAFFAVIVGTMCSPAAGLVVDRVRRRPLLICLNLATAVLVLPLLLVHGRSDLWICYAVLAGYGFLSGLIGSAETALMQAMVPAEQLGAANGLQQTLLQGLRLVAPLLGAGLLTAFGIAPLVLGDVATFLAGVLLLSLMRVDEKVAERSREPLGRQLTAGVRHIVAVPVLRQLVFATVLAVVAFGCSETVMFAVVGQGLHRPPGFLGLLFSAQGIGGVAGGLVAAAVLRRTGAGRLVALGLAAAAVAFLLLTLPSLFTAVPAVVLIGVSLPWVIVGLMTVMQQNTPPELMGRADTALNVLISAPQAAAIGAGAALLAVVDFRLMLAGMAALMALGGGYLATRREQRAPAPEAATADAEPGPEPDPADRPGAALGS
ncbi:MFS transporter [Streptacidiphilus sp. EB129]|uniref:MFS transporter n=1 Tax=Streptacidiphilus sp. EB129 TaxID=3156262 RepID=UPI0035153314